MDISLQKPYRRRREDLVKQIEKSTTEDFLVLLIGNLESESCMYNQDSNFIYYTGIEEPAVISTFGPNIDMIWVPTFKTSRRQWVESEINVSPEDALKHDIDEIRPLGQSFAGYSVNLNSDSNCYDNLIKYLKDNLKKKIFIPYEMLSATQRVILGKIQSVIGQPLNIADCSNLIKSQRMIKSNLELDKIYRAIEITYNANQSVAKAIKPGVYEKEIDALIDYVFKVSGASNAFPSIVGTGFNGTVLHYNSGLSELKKDELVVIDCGAKYDYYCADITRTYPVSGIFSSRQAELYNIVLETQTIIAENARPGIWLNNPEEPENSLQHIAINFLKSKNLDKYFVHGIGHHLGLDVHDVNIKRPLMSGDVITIEPGIYIPDEKIGIRIEDNYWIMPDGSICLSESIPKKISEIEELMSSKDE